MNNVTTPQTAAALKAAGFPQPVPAFGQVWYNRNGHLCICIKKFTHDSLPGVMFFNTATEATFSLPQSEFLGVKKHGTFAPTATDILRELDADVSISHDAGTWICCIFCGPDFVNDNPAEAAALAWLAVNKH